MSRPSVSLPKYDRAQWVSAILVVLPFTVIAGFFVSGKYQASLITFAVALVAWTGVFVYQVIANRAGHFQWLVATQMPGIVTALALLGVSAYLAHQYFDLQTTQSLGPIALTASGQVSFAALSLLVALVLLRRAYLRIKPLSGQRQISSSLGSISLKQLPPVTGELGPAFELTAKVCPAMSAMRPQLVVLERTDGGRGTNVVWTTHRVGRRSNLGIFLQWPATTGHARLDREGAPHLVISDGTKLYIAPDYGNRTAAELDLAGKQLRCVVYIERGGFLQSTVTLPVAA